MNARFVESGIAEIIQANAIPVKKGSVKSIPPISPILTICRYVRTAPDNVLFVKKLWVYILSINAISADPEFVRYVLKNQD
jgi:hypothetical protein